MKFKKGDRVMCTGIGYDKKRYGDTGTIVGFTGRRVSAPHISYYVIWDHLSPNTREAYHPDFLTKIAHDYQI
jgi:hypothetical protein